MGMAARTPADSAPHLVFRSRAVRIAAAVDLAVGVVVILVGVGLGVSGGTRDAVPLSVVIGLVGVALLVSGLSRATARMEISKTRVTWTWSFARQGVDLVDLDDAALVEKGAPAPGGAWAGFLGGGIAMVLVWWLFDVVSAFVTSEPGLGPVHLVVIKHVGGPVPVQPISTWSTRASHSGADEALAYLQAAIAASPRRGAATPEILRTDAWEQPGEH